MQQVQAYVHANDYFFDASFDATPWFEQASDEEITELANANWTGIAADKLARFAEGHSGLVNVVLDYCRRKDSQGQPVGFSVEIHPGMALAWLEQHRPQLYEKLGE